MGHLRYTWYSNINGEHIIEQSRRASIFYLKLQLLINALKTPYNDYR